MDRRYYIIGWRPEYAQLLRRLGFQDDIPEAGKPERIIVCISQGGFGEGVVDFRTQVQERFLDYELSFRGLDLQPTAETFDEYFTLEEPADFVDLDQE